MNKILYLLIGIIITTGFYSLFLLSQMQYVPCNPDDRLCVWVFNQTEEQNAIYYNNLHLNGTSNLISWISLALCGIFFVFLMHTYQNRDFGIKRRHRKK